MTALSNSRTPKDRPRVLASWFGILALVFQVLIPFGQGIALADVNDVTGDDSLFLTICKAMQTGTTPSETPAPADSNGLQCPVCLSFSSYSPGQHFLAPDTVIHFNQSVDYGTDQTSASLAHKGHSQREARAPPSST